MNVTMLCMLAKGNSKANGGKSKEKEIGVLYEYRTKVGKNKATNNPTGDGHPIRYQEPADGRSSAGFLLVPGPVAVPLFNIEPGQ